MTAEEYERRPDVKDALAFVRHHPELVRTGSFSTFKHRLMRLLGIPEEEYMGWDVPTELLYAQKRVGATGERGWSKKDAYRQVVDPAIKAGRMTLGAALKTFTVIEQATREVPGGLRDIPEHHPIFRSVERVLDGPSNHGDLDVGQKMTVRLRASGTSGIYSIWRTA
jgi:hypothetical protein